MPRIPDPKMNPSGERTYGIVSNEDDGHYDIYIKKDTNQPTDSRFLPAGTKVNIGNLHPAFLLKFKNELEFLDDYGTAEYKKGNIVKGVKNIESFNNSLKELNTLLAKSDFELVVVDWNEDSLAKPVIVDYTEELTIHADASKEDVKEQLRQRAYDYLKAK
jgi:hypothetical protein